MGQRTPLYDLHLALGAKMVDFGGWDMPLHYGSQVEEHHQVRRDCGEVVERLDRLAPWAQIWFFWGCVFCVSTPARCLRTTLRAPATAGCSMYPI